MMTNVGILDRGLRVIVGLALLGWTMGYYGPALPEWGDTLVTVIGGYPFVTGLLRYCPLYSLAGLSTCAEEA